MRLFRKVGILCLTVCMLACLAVGTIFTMSYAEPVKSGYGNAQLYKNNDIKFEDRLFDVDYYKANQSNWKIVSGPYAENNWGSGNFNYAGYDTLNRGLSGYDATMDAYLIDGTYYYGDTTGGVNRLTKVFVYVGFPDADYYPMPEGGYPAMLCVHGGGGTAYSQWVAEWTSRGYVAIAMDTEAKLPVGITGGGTTFYGQIDQLSKSPAQLYNEISSGDAALSAEALAILNSKLGDTSTIGSHYYAKQNAWFHDTLYGTDYKTHWFYQATAAVIASNTFIRSFDNVNPEKIGITGISYGSYLTSLALGYDGRFACAVPIYGSLNQQIGDKYFAQSTQPTDSRNSTAGGLWDNPVILKGVTTPTLYLMSNHDAHFDVRSSVSCARLQTDARVVIRDQYPHSHSYGALYGNENASPFIDDVVDFVESYLRNDRSKALPKVDSYIFNDGNNYIFDVKSVSGAAVTSANLYYVTKELLINDLSYYYGQAASVYGDYAFGDIIGNWYDESNPSGTDLYFGKEGRWENCYNVWTKVALNTPSNQGNDVYRVFFSPTDTTKLPSNATFFYIEVVDANGHYLTSQVMDIGSQERPLYTDRIYDYNALRKSGAVEEFDWAADENGWAIQDRTANWDKAYGILKFTKVVNQETQVEEIQAQYGWVLGGDTDRIGTCTDGVNTYQVPQSHYGARSQSYADGVTSIYTDGASVINYRAFNVYNDIEFFYNISSKDSYMSDNGETTDGGHCYFFSLYDNIYSAFRTSATPWEAGADAPKINLSGANCDVEDGNSITRTPLNGALGVNMMPVYGNDPRYSEYLYDENVTVPVQEGQEYKSNYRLYFTTPKFFNNGTFNLTTANWDDVWYKVTIRIGEEGTYVFVNGQSIIDPATNQPYMLDVTRGDFKNGFAYLSYSNSGDMTVNLKMQETQLLNKFNKEIDFSNTDANGFGIYEQKDTTEFFLNGDASSSVVAGREFGAVEQYSSGGISTFVFNDDLTTGTGAVKNPETGAATGATYEETDGSVIRYVPFDINEDIQFSYNFTPEVIDDITGNVTNNFYYYIGLYDSLYKAFASRDEGWEAYLENSPVISLSGSNMSGTSKDGYNRSDVNGRVQLYADSNKITSFWTTDTTTKSERYSWNFYPTYPDKTSQSGYSQGIIEDNWDNYYVDVRISIGENSTSIYLDGSLYLTTTQFKKANFPSGLAYFKFYAFVQSGEVKVNIKLNDEAPDLYHAVDENRTTDHFNTFPIAETYYSGQNKTGNKYSFATNAYGWSERTRSTDVDAYGNPNTYYDANNVAVVNWWDASNYMVTHLDQEVTTAQFTTDVAGSSIINHIGFDVREDIVFKYKVNEAGVATNVDETTGATTYSPIDGSFYVFAFFDSIDSAYRSGQSPYDVSASATAPAKIAFQSTNTPYIATREAYCGRLINSGSGSFVNVSEASGASSQISPSYILGRDQEEYNELRIRVLTDKTLVYLNGELWGYFTNIDRSSFKSGYAYLKVFDYAFAGWGANGTTTFDLITSGRILTDKKYDYAMDKYNCVSTSLVELENNHGWASVDGEWYLDNQFGLEEAPTVSLNKASIKLNHSYVINYRGFDVTKDIEFKYSVSDPVYGANGEINHTSLWYNFALFPSAELAGKAGMQGWLTSTNNAPLTLFGCNEPSGRVPAMEEDNIVSYTYVNDYGKLRINGSYGTQKTAVKPSTERLVRIRILDDCTEVYVDNELTVTINDVNRAKFIYGYAYLQISAAGEGTMNIEYNRELELMNYPTGKVYDYATDANGWTTYKNSDSNIRQSKMPALYNVDFNPDQPYDEATIVGDCYFSRNNGAEINNKGQSVLNLGLSRVDSNGNESINELSLPTYAVQTTGFDVDKPIRLVYRMSSAAEFNNVMNKRSCLIMSFTDNLNDAYEIATEGWNEAVGLQKLMLRTTNALWEGDGSWTDATYAGRITGFKCTTGDESTMQYRSDFLYDCTIDQYTDPTVDSSLWQKDITIDILIGKNPGETRTIVNGIAYDLGYGDVTQSDFEFGKAYLNLCSHGGLDIAIATSQTEVGYEPTTTAVLEDSVDLVNTFELPVGYYNPRLVYEIIDNYSIEEFEIDGGIIEFTSGYVSPHHIGKDIKVKLYATSFIKNAETNVYEEKEVVVDEKTFVMKDYLKGLLEACGDSEGAKKELINSLLNLGGAAQLTMSHLTQGDAVPVENVQTVVKTNFDALNVDLEPSYITSTYSEKGQELKDNKLFQVKGRELAMSSKGYLITEFVGKNNDANFDISKVTATITINGVTQNINSFTYYTLDNPDYNLYKIESDPIHCTNFDDNITTVIYYDGEVIHTTHCSMAGLNLVQIKDGLEVDAEEATETAEETFAKAFYLYWAAVEAYNVAI